MFGSGFSLGFTLSDVTAQVTGFLGNPVIIGLIATGLALNAVYWIVRVVQEINYAGWDQWSSDVVSELHGVDPYAEPRDDYEFTDQDMHNMEGY
jgi:hypothetical protein